MQKGYAGEPRFITERRNRIMRHQLEGRAQYDREIDEALALAKHKPVEEVKVKKGFMYYVDKLADIVACGPSPTMSEIFKEAKEEYGFGTRRIG